MKFSGTIEIKKPRSLVVDLFMNPDYLKHYQDGFKSKELISGEVGKDGAISKMIYKMGKQDMELIETITANLLPDSFEAHYHHVHMDNTMTCRFAEIDEQTTSYFYEFEYTRLSWVMPRLIAILFPTVYIKQGEKWLRQFKEFVERQT